MRDVVTRLASGPSGPVRLAVALAIVATPVVALSFLAPPIFEVDESFEPPTLGAALLVAAVATVGAALAAGSIGGLLVRDRPTLGALVALAIAWPLAVAITPVAATALGQRFETGYSCFDTCGAMIHTGDPASGAGAYVVALMVSVVTIVPLVVLGLCVFGAYKLNRTGYPLVATGLLGLGYGSVHWIAVLGGAPPLVGLLCLVAGVSIWTWALRVSEPEAEAAVVR